MPAETYEIINKILFMLTEAGETINMTFLLFFCAFYSLSKILFIPLCAENLLIKKYMVEQIQSFGMTKMTVGSSCDFHMKVVLYIDKSGSDLLHIKTQTPVYKEKVKLLQSIVNRQHGFVATADLKRTDQKRDNAAGTICAVITAYKTSPVAEKQKAAELLDPQLSPYRGIRSHEYTKQTSEVKGMLTMLDMEINEAAIATLGLEEEVEALREANDAFDKAILAKGTEMNAKSIQSDISTKDLLGEINALYREIVKVVNAYAIADTNAGIRKFIANVNGLVGIYANIAGSARSGGSAPEGDGAEFPDT